MFETILTIISCFSCGAIGFIGGYLIKKTQEYSKEHGMSVEEYRIRMMQAFHNADADELLFIAVYPSKDEFKYLEEYLRKKEWNNGKKD